MFRIFCVVIVNLVVIDLVFCVDLFDEWGWFWFEVSRNCYE